MNCRPIADLRSTRFSHVTLRHTSSQPDEVARLQHDDVELAVVDLGVGDELDVAGQVAEVRDEDARHPRPVQPPGVGAMHHAERLRRGDRPQAGVDVGEPAHPLLQVGVRVRDHRGVDADARHHERGVRLVACRRAGSPRRRARRRRGRARRRRARRRRPGRSRGCRGCGRRGCRCRAARSRAARPLPRTAGRDRAHGAVAARRDHEVDARRRAPACAMPLPGSSAVVSIHIDGAKPCRVLCARHRVAQAVDAALGGIEDDGRAQRASRHPPFSAPRSPSPCQRYCMSPRGRGAARAVSAAGRGPDAPG